MSDHPNALHPSHPLRRVDNLCGTAGIVAIVVGAFMIHVGFGLIVLGSLLVLLALTDV